MKTASIRELRHETTKVIEWVENGEKVEISRRGKVIAHLSPVPPPKMLRKLARAKFKERFSRPPIVPAKPIEGNIVLQMREEEESRW